MKKILLAATALTLTATPAYANRPWQHPDWTDGSIPLPDWGVLSTYPTGSAPADVYEPEAVAPTGFTRDDWLAGHDGSSYDAHQGAEFDKKFRIECEPNVVLPEDPVKFPGQGAVSHDHQGSGLVAWNADTTYSIARLHPNSSCGGGPLFPNLYIAPAMKKLLPSGVTASVRPQLVTNYYVEGQQSQPNVATWLRRDQDVIFGADPGNYNDTTNRAAYAAGGMEYPGSPETPAGTFGFQCVAGGGDGIALTVTDTNARMQSSTGAVITDHAKYFRGPGGTDPWGGTCTGSVATPGTLIVDLIAPDCWDRHNLHGDDGRRNYVHSTRVVDGATRGLCPTVVVNGVRQEYGRVPRLQVKEQYYHTGFSDYGTWYASSDRMRMATAECPDPTAPCDGTGLNNVVVSKDDCRRIGVDFCSGATFHADWKMLADDETFETMERECLGITVRGVAPTDGPAECPTFMISRDYALRAFQASPDASLSQCAEILGCFNSVPGNIERYSPIPVGTTGNFTLHGSH